MFGYLTPDQVTLVRIAIVVFLILFFTTIAVVSAARTQRPHIGPFNPPPVDLRTLPTLTEISPIPGKVECPRCGGAGVVDFHDDWIREIMHDAPCPRCGGSGRVEDVA